MTYDGFLVLFRNSSINSDFMAQAYFMKNENFNQMIKDGTIQFLLNDGTIGKDFLINKKPPKKDIIRSSNFNFSVHLYAYQKLDGYVVFDYSLYNQVKIERILNILKKTTKSSNFYFIQKWKFNYLSMPTLDRKTISDKIHHLIEKELISAQLKKTSTTHPNKI